MRRGQPLDWSGIRARYVDLWQEARMVVWRAKHHKPGLKMWDEKEQKNVQTYIPDDRMVMDAINCTKGLLDSLVRLRREAGHEASGIPSWAIERIERALRNYPEAQTALLKELIAGNEKQAEDVDDTPNP